MKKLTVWALLAMFVVAGAAFAAPAKIAPNASDFGTGAPATTNNDESCDIGVYPAATLLLPYFEVAEDRGGENTIFTITNVSAGDVIAHVVLWTDYSYPVIDFNIYLTGYDVQSINLWDVIWDGIIAPETDAKDAGTGTDISPEGDNSGDDGWNESDSANCDELPGELDSFFTDRMQSAFVDGTVEAVAGTDFDECDTVGNEHENAVGYATIDVSDTCNVALPTDGDEYFENEIGFANVLIGDFQQINSDNDFAQGNPMVHIRAVPEGTDDSDTETNFDRTFYSRYQTQVAGVPGTVDRRQPLPSVFAARWINLGENDWQTYFKIWREGVTDAPASTDCDAVPDNGQLAVTETVVFDEDENGTGITTEDEIVSPSPGVEGIELPETSLTAIDDDDLFPQGLDSSAGWVYFNLDYGTSTTYPGTSDADNEFASQNWVVISMRAEGRYSVDFDAAALGNGCTPPQELSEFSEDSSGDGDGIIGPANNDTGCVNVCP